MHKLKYLPLALNDLRDITNYITGTLKAPKAAMDLLNALDESIFRLQQFPYFCKVYHPIKDLENEYRLLPVKNYAASAHQVIGGPRFTYNFLSMSWCPIAWRTSVSLSCSKMRRISIFT